MDFELNEDYKSLMKMLKENGTKLLKTPMECQVFYKDEDGHYQVFEFYRWTYFQECFKSKHRAKMWLKGYQVYGEF